MEINHSALYTVLLDGLLTCKVCMTKADAVHYT